MSYNVFDRFTMFVLGVVVGLLIAGIIAEVCENKQQKQNYEFNEED